jgi:hypothetical protein
MMSHVLLAALLAAPAAPGPNPAMPRQALAKCLRVAMVADLKEKTAAPAFQTKLATLCQAERDAYRNTSIASDVAAGIRRSTAEQNAADDLKDMMESATDRYKEYLESNTSPQ